VTLPADVSVWLRHDDVWRQLSPQLVERAVGDHSLTWHIQYTLNSISATGKIANCSIVVTVNADSIRECINKNDWNLTKEMSKYN